MSKAKGAPLLVIALFFALALSAIIPNQMVTVKASPNSPYQGSGTLLDVHEFARNESSTFTNGVNGTTFTYADSWFPSGYSGYRLHAQVSDVRRVADPVPNGDFENVTGFSDTWNLTQADALINTTAFSLNPVLGGNPNYCMDMALAYGRVNFQRVAYIDNDFNYTSAITPDSLRLYFDVQFSGDVTQQDWLVLTVSIINEGQVKGSWSANLADTHEPTWESYDFVTTSVNGPVRLRITLEKTDSKNLEVEGHIYFDNFRYEIGSYVKPSEAALKLNGTSVIDTVGSSGEVNIYADPSQMDETAWVDCWSTSQVFEFTSTYETISFHYSYSMYVKQINTEAANTFFTAPVDGTPDWQASYFVAIGTPSGHVGYSLGIYLEPGWALYEVNDTSGPIIDYTYNETSQFVKLDQATVSETYSFFATSSNYVLSVYAQKGPTSTGPWTDVTSSGYLVKDEYIRVKAQLRPIGPSVDNFANVSLFYPNESMWLSAITPINFTIDDSTDSLTTPSWQIPTIGEVDIGQPWLITVAFDNQTQCGMRKSTFILVVATRATEEAPAQHSDQIWGSSILVNVTWQNNETNSYIKDATAQIRYVDRNGLTRFDPMFSNNMGAYSLEFSTVLMAPNRNAEFHVELFRYGYVNASYDEGTQVTFTVNLINDLELIMIRPTQLTGTNEYTGETTSSQGYWSQIKLYDPYRSAYVLNESSFWPAVHVDYEYYEDTGSGFGSPIASDHFSHNASDRTFNKIDSSYPIAVDAVKYEVSVRIDASWDFVEIDFTIIIVIVDYATNLDAVQTVISYPPEGFGSGWTEFNPVSDNYEVHLYWNEIFNITVYYENSSTLLGITGATVNLLVGETNLFPLAPAAAGYYTYNLSTATLDLGLNLLQVNATYPDHAKQTILIGVFVESRATLLSRNHTGSTFIAPWGTDFVLTFTFSDYVTGSPFGITDATPDVVFGGLQGNYSKENNLDGTYTITFNGGDLEATYYITITFTRTNYTSQSQYYEFTIREVWTQSFGFATPSSVPWGDLVNITLNYDDLDNLVGISGATILLSWQDNQTDDYWIVDNLDGSYSITLNTTKVAAGTVNFILEFTITKDHYLTAHASVAFQVRDRQTILYIADYEPGTSIPWGDSLTLFLQFVDTDHTPNEQITDAVITCDWDAFYWSITPFNSSHNAYLLIIQTSSRLEGSYEINIFASRTHFRDGSNRHSFIIRTIRTGITADPQYVPSHLFGTNLNITIHYFDLDHGSIGLNSSEITSDWAASYYTIYELGNGWYIIELNTTGRGKGTHDLTITASLLPHYETQELPVTIIITAMPISVKVLEPPSGQLSVTYNTLITITVSVTDLQMMPIDDANVTYQWAGRDPIQMISLGNGIYNISFYANADVLYNHPITIIAANDTKYNPGFGTVLVYIIPIETALALVTESVDTIIGEAFEISVNFTSIDGLPIDGALVSYAWLEQSTGSLLNVDPGIYNGTLDVSGLAAGDYTIYITASKETMREQQITIRVTINRIPTQIIGLPSTISVQAGNIFNIYVTLMDTYHNTYITDANLNITIAGLRIYSVLLENHHNGTYSMVNIPAPLLAGDHQILIEISGSSIYQDTSAQSTLIVNPDPTLSNIVNLVALSSVIIIILLVIWLAYARIFSVPWMVRKMRKMSKTIGKGDIPTLSKGEVGRIADRSDQLSEIINPYYGVIGLPARANVLPAEIDWKERDAEDEAIWSEIKALPILEYEQRLELFQQMKQIPPSERVWFLEDLKKQMADGTRFARKVKEPEISEELEQELQTRLATFPALSKTEKDRIAAQLRKLPKEEWAEIFLTLAASQKQPKPQVEVLAPDELPSLSEEEKQRVLEEIKDLTEEERQKVLRTLREKRSEDAPKGTVVKGKKKFIVDESEDTG
ncbi:MAG: hypothetical protein ACFFAL_00225 [Promethearchaeota archaeon]